MNSVVLAERRFGDYAYANLIYISIGDGLGSGILINDHLLRQAWRCRRIRSYERKPRGIRCECGNVGAGQLHQLDCRVFANDYGDRNRETDADPGAERGDYSKIVPSVFKEALRRGTSSQGI